MTRVGDYLRQNLLVTLQPRNAPKFLHSSGLSKRVGTLVDLECSHIEVHADILGLLVLQAVLYLLDRRVVDEVEPAGHRQH
jgi:hypothetical protein